MLKYLRLYRAFLVASLKADLGYRMNFLSRIVSDLFWYSAQIITFETLFRHTEKLGSWNLAQTRVFLGVIFVVDAFYMIILSDNLDRISDRVRKGDLDLLLAKPVNSQFMLSCQRANTAIAGNLIIGSSWLLWSLAHLPDFSWWKFFWIFFLIPMGLISIYGARFIIATSAIVFTRSENLQYLWHQIHRLGMRPDSIYPLWLRTALMSVLPLALIASVPSRFLIEEFDISSFLILLIVPMAFLFLSHWVWNKALKSYTSASS